MRDRRLGLAIFLFVLPFLILGGCGKKELSRNAAEKIISSSADFSRTISILKFHEYGLEKAMKHGVWEAANYQPRLTSHGSEFFAGISRDRLELREPARGRVKVTGISDAIGLGGSSGGVKEAQFTWDYESLPSVAKRYVVAGGGGRALFRLYDDGWRLEELHDISFSTEPVKLSDREKSDEEADETAMADRKRVQAEQAEEAAAQRAKREAESRSPTTTIAEYEGWADTRDFRSSNWTKGPIVVTDVDATFTQDGRLLTVGFGIIRSMEPVDEGAAAHYLLVHFTGWFWNRQGARIYFLDAPSRDQAQKQITRAVQAWREKFRDLLVGVPSAAEGSGSPNDLQRQKQTMATLRSLATACEAYSVDHGFYPSANSLEQLTPIVTPSYIRSVPLLDAWGNAFAFEGDKSTYEIRSCGQDGQRDSTQPAGAVKDPARDIVFSRGQFIQWPEGVSDSER